MRAAAAVVLLALAALGGCSDEPDPATTSSPTSATTASATATGGQPAGTTPTPGQVQYVAMGDSYASGLGAGDYDTSGCARSAHAYPQLVAKQRGYHLTQVSCSGASIRDVRANQLGALTADTEAVTITVGGNDLQLMTGLGLCAMRDNDDACAAVFGQGSTTADENLRAPLTALYRDIRAAAPKAVVVAVGYPRLFETGQCPSEPGFSARERALLNQASDTLNNITAQAAAEAGVRFVSATQAFAGHGVCGADPWLHGTHGLPTEALHPNREGQQAYASVLPTQ